MKMTKTDFKGMIKECIKELIKDGAFAEVLAESVNTNKQSVTNKQSSFRAAAKELISDTPKVDKDKLKAQAAQMSGYYEGMGESSSTSEARPINEHVKKLISMTANEMGKGNSKLSSTYAAIFEDTAIHTLPHQLANDTGAGGGGMAALTAAGMQNQEEKVAPAQLEAMAIDGDMSRWAKVAFNKRT
jgi:hypothetical protein